MCEHDMTSQVVMTVAERHQVVIVNKHAEFRRTEKVGEGMALKIWAELRQPFGFILIP